MTHDDRDLTWEVQRHDHRTLFVGLGGTGKEIIARAKARLLSLADGSRSPAVGFLVIDVDPSPPKTPGLESVLGPEEVCNPSRLFPPSQVQREVLRHMTEGSELHWVGERVPPGEMTLGYDSFVRGAESRRQAGLLAYLWEEHSSAGVTSALRVAIERVVERARGDVSLSIFLVSSVCGGTGGGMLLDTAWLARGIGLDYSACSCDVSALLILPGVFRRLVDDPTYETLQRNALATLTELDYFMYPEDQRSSRTGDPGGVPWLVRSAAHGGRVLDSSGAALQTVFLIDNQRNRGGTLDGPDVVFPAVADMLVHLSGTLIGDRFAEALNNAKATLRRRFTGDRTAVDRREMPHYSSLGLVRIVLPVRGMAVEAAGVLSGDVLERLRGSGEAPDEPAVADALRSLGLDPESATRLVANRLAASLADALDLRACARNRIAIVSERVTEHVRLRLQGEILRRECLDSLEKAKSAVVVAQDGLRGRLDEQLAGAVEVAASALDNRLAEMRGRDRGWVWLAKLLGGVIEAADRHWREAAKASACERSDAVDRAEEVLRQAQERLRRCPAAEVRVTALRAARQCDEWLNQKLNLVSAQMRGQVLADSLPRLRGIAEAADALADLLAGSLPREVPLAVAALRQEDAGRAPIVDLAVAADGRLHYEALDPSVREGLAASCAEAISLELRDGLPCLCGDAGEPGGRPLLLGPGRRPSEAARAWVSYLADRLEPHFASLHLDDFLPSDEVAGHYAEACVGEAGVFVKCDPTAQRDEGNEPIKITLAVVPENSRLQAAFGNHSNHSGVVCPQSRAPREATLFRAEIGILGRVLQLRKDGAALEAGMVTQPGLWTLGQLSHDIFWGEPSRWADLGLFFLSLAASRIKREAPPREEAGASSGRGHAYVLTVVGRGQKIKLGVGLQAAILEFLSPNQEVYRRQLWRDLGEEESREAVRQALPAVLRRCAKLATQPAEVPTAPLRIVLGRLLRSLKPEPSQ